MEKTTKKKAATPLIERVSKAGVAALNPVPYNPRVWAKRLEKAAKERRGGARRGAGRPLKYSPALAGQVLAALHNGATRRYACTYADISQDTFARWLRDFSEFAEAVHSAEGKAVVTFTSAIMSAAREDWRAAAFWLKHRCRDEWFEHRDLGGEVNLHATGGSITISPAEVHQRIREVYGLEPPEDAKEPTTQ